VIEKNADLPQGVLN